jgi:hypothetical protein
MAVIISDSIGRALQSNRLGELPEVLEVTAFR